MIRRLIVAAVLAALAAPAAAQPLFGPFDINPAAITTTTSREVLSGARQVEVNCATGNDTTGNGTIGAPWATITNAVTQTQKTLDLAGFTLTIKVADGTCTGDTFVSGTWTGQYTENQVVIKGNVATPANVVLAGTSNTVFALAQSRFALRGFKLASATASGIHSTDGSLIVYSHLDFGAMPAGFHIICQKLGQAYDNAGITVDAVLGTQTISGGALRHSWSSAGGTCYETEGTTTLSGTPAFTHYAYADVNSAFLSHTKTYSGAATGTRFFAGRNSSVETFALTTLPGSIAGSTDDSSIFSAGDGSWSGSYPIKKVQSAVDWSLQNTSNKVLAIVQNTASAVNGLDLRPSATGNNVAMAAFGDDTNIILDLRGKGTGGAAVLGTSTNNNATAGYVGEYVESIVLTASAVSLTNTVAANITSISLTAGDWDVVATSHTKPAATTNITLANLGISTTSATILVGSGTYASLAVPSGGVVYGVNPTPSMHVVSTRISLASTTTVYLVTTVFFTVDTCAAFGQIAARRVR